MSFTVHATFKCEKCGARVTWADDATENTKLTCAKCGDDLGTYGDLRNQAATATAGKVAWLLKDGFKRR